MYKFPNGSTLYSLKRATVCSSLWLCPTKDFRKIIDLPCDWCKVKPMKLNLSNCAVVS